MESENMENLLFIVENRLHFSATAFTWSSVNKCTIDTHLITFQFPKLQFLVMKTILGLLP